MDLAQIDFSGKKILVTGGTGFVGSRLAERLALECNASVRVLARNLSRAIRISRFPIEIVTGDITRSEDVERAAAGCDYIFNCAYGNQGDKDIRRLVNVEGTRNVLRAALHNSVKRVIHLSSFTVYGADFDGDLNETFPRNHVGHVYIDSKIDSENIAFDYYTNHGLPVVVIQPTAVYGPYAPVWTVDVIQKLKTGRIILVNNGSGFRNVVYIDNLVDALLLAAEKEEAAGETFLISDERPVTFREFYRSFERMLGVSGTVNMSAKEAKAYNMKKMKQKKGKSIFSETVKMLRDEPIIRERILSTREALTLKRMIRFMLSEQTCKKMNKGVKSNGRIDRTQVVYDERKPIHTLDHLTIKLYSAKVIARIDKAKKMLGYKPSFNFESGMKLTGEWARWANLLD